MYVCICERETEREKEKERLLFQAVTDSPPTLVLFYCFSHIRTGLNLAQELRKPDGERKGEMNHRCWNYSTAPTNDKLPLFFS